MPLAFAPGMLYTSKPTKERPMPTDLTDLSPVTNPDAQEALSRVQGNTTVMLVPLKNGSVAVFGRDFSLHAILDEAPSYNELVNLSTELALKLLSRRAEAAFYGEPSDKDWKRDILRARRSEGHSSTNRIIQPKSVGVAFDLGEE